MRHAWRSIGPLLLLAILVAGCNSQRPIVQDLDQPEANEIVVKLARQGIPAEKVKQETAGGGSGEAAKFSISVAASDRDRALDFLNQIGLPRPRGRNLLGIFGQGGLVPNDFEQKIKFQAGLEEQLAGIIRQMDGVLAASVQLSLPEENPLAPESEKKEKTAAIYVKHTGALDDPNQQLKTKIRSIVAGSISGLKLENVVVIPERTQYSADSASASFDGNSEGEREYARVWTVVVAKESVGRFQTIFFSLSLITLLLALALVWILWKYMAVISATGGFRSLLRPAPVQMKDLHKGMVPAEAQPSKGDKSKEKEKANRDDEDDEA